MLVGWQRKDSWVSEILPETVSPREKVIHLKNVFLGFCSHLCTGKSVKNMMQVGKANRTFISLAAKKNFHFSPFLAS